MPVSVSPMGFPSGTSGKEPACQCWRCKRHRQRFHPWIRKILWRRAGQPTPVFLPGESQRTEEPGMLQSIAWRRVGHYWTDLACTHDSFKVVAHVSYHQGFKGSSCSSSWPFRYILILFNFSFSGVCEMVNHCDFNLYLFYN